MSKPKRKKKAGSGAKPPEAKAAGEDQAKNKGRQPPPAEYRWKPGQSGNPKGRPKGPSLKDALVRLLAKLGEEETLEKLAQLWIDEAKKGNDKFFMELLNRLDGKVTQPVDVDATLRTTWLDIVCERMGAPKPGRGE